MQPHGFERGREALARGAWADARTAFEAVLSAASDNAVAAEALEGLGWVGWWTADAELAIGSRERAFRGFRARGDDCAAARVAAWLAADYREFRCEVAVGQGWLRRAQRLLEDAPECADHGWVRLLDADHALNVDADVARTERLSLSVAELGRRLGVADLEAVGLAQGGIAAVLQGRVEDGMRALDEASAIAVGEDLLLPVSTIWSLCCLISACDGVGDFPRAQQWAKTMRRFNERWGARHVVGVCRTAYGRVLATHGDWRAADAELTAAVDDLQASRPGMAGGGLVRLAELRIRQGRADEARALLEEAGPAGLVGLGQLALDGGDPRAAADAAERVLRAVPADAALGRLPALELLARARAMLGDAEAATAACAAVAETVAPIGTPYLRARARFVAGEAAAARGAWEEARRACEDAVDCFAAGSAPYEAALARAALARVLDALGQHERAAAERAAAEKTFAALGAARDLERLETAKAGAVGAGGELNAAGELTARELEVLRLVAQGLSDAQIAERLVVSQHTVHRHVANVRTKLRLPSRAAAVAYAAREGLL